MLKGFDDVWNISKEEKITLRDAAFILSITKIAQAVELRGIFP
jgi:glutamate dehydrogenase/leucine dehydrogenase